MDAQFLQFVREELTALSTERWKSLSEPSPDAFASFVQKQREKCLLDFDRGGALDNS